MNKPASDQGKTVSELIDSKTDELEVWRGATLARMRRLTREADRFLAVLDQLFGGSLIFVL